MSLTIVPCSFKAANDYVKAHHRHNTRVLVARIALAVADEQQTIHGVGIAALPVARALDDGRTLEARRVCTDGYKNACSCLYAALWRAARAIGYTSMITYTLVTEPGSSLRALGWRIEETIKAKSWAACSKQRTRQDQAVYHVDKYRWRVGEVRT